MLEPTQRLPVAAELRGWRRGRLPQL